MAKVSCIISSSDAKRDGMGKPPSPLWAGLVLVANPMAPAAMASRTNAAISEISEAVASRLLASSPMTQVRTEECPM